MGCVWRLHVPHVEFRPSSGYSTLVLFGNSGVAFFFVLSGFVLTYSARPATTTRNFYWRRFGRIYPAHIVALLLAVLCFIRSQKLRKAPGLSRSPSASFCYRWCCCRGGRTIPRSSSPVTPLPGHSQLKLFLQAASLGQ
ncbi:acyltransferase [Leucobacter sp. G161]|uniref:acyltransferase family protein n=1 Tax=Leucobacter sp. G161 TaxID=663704 RepID=UPI00128F0017